MKANSPFFEFPGERIDLLFNVDDSPVPSIRWRLIAAISGLLISVVAFHLAVNVFTGTIVRFTTNQRSILFISDIHLDPLFNDRSNASVSCHVTDPSLPTTFRFGKYGCDTPEPLLDSLVENLPRLVHRPTVIVLGGDYAAGVRNAPPEFYIPLFQTIRAKISRAFPNTPILPVLGNSEFSPNYGDWSNDSLNYLNAARAWNGLLDRSENETAAKGGYFYRDYERVRIVVLNTVMYHLYRDPTNESDPFGQFAWLERVCESAAAQKLELIVFFHVPPSISTRDRFQYQGWYPAFIDRFAAVYRKYRFAMICGHIHIDALMPLFNYEGLHGGYIMSSPGISLRHDSNPGFRLFKLNNGRLVDYIQFYADVIENPKETLTWHVQYSFRELYGARDLSQEELTRVTRKILSDSLIMWKYREMMYTKNYDKRAFHRCMLVSASRKELEMCMAESVEKR
jgi:sphingomyelin phosphodiesterase acid-like 3